MIILSNLRIKNLKVKIFKISKLKNIKEDYFVNQTLIIDRALHLEKDLNDKLLELHKCKSNYEMSCRVKNKNVFKTFKPIPEGNNDPHVIITIIIFIFFSFIYYLLLF